MSIVCRAFSTHVKHLIPLAKAQNVAECGTILRSVPWEKIPQKDLVEFLNDAMKWQEAGGFDRTRGQMLAVAASKTLNEQAHAAFKAGCIYRALTTSHVEVEPK